MSDRADTDPPPRRRDSAATRRALLDAARVAFSESGYDNAGLRSIAHAAGADARLIGRYFGSKEALFAAVLDEVYDMSPALKPADIVDTARALLDDRKLPSLDGLLLTLRSASSPIAVELMRGRMENDAQVRLAAALPGSYGDGRAALLIAICAGVQLVRDVLGATALTDESTRDALSPYLEAALSAVAVGPAART
ncbi:MAG: TetR family transcriptional regulator [Mycobacterium sp.]